MMADSSKQVRPEININTQAFKIVQNVLLACKNETINHQHMLKQEGLVKCPKKRAALYTGMPLQIIEYIGKETSSYPEVDLSLHLVIRRTLKKFYSKEEEITCRQLYDILRYQYSNNTFDRQDSSSLAALSPNLSGFTEQLIKLGYESVKTIDGSEVILEIPKYTFERYHYLKKIMKARTLDNKIYYLSVRIYNNEKKSMVPVGKNILIEPLSNVLILYHLISKDRCENVFFAYNYDKEHLIKWILQILIPSLKPSSLVVLDNRHIFDFSAKDFISEYHPKKDMIKWLRNHNLPCTPTMPKAELYELIQKCSVKLQHNTLENILQSFGHDVLCVPEQIHHLVPTHLLWHDLNNKLKLQLLKSDLVSNTIESIIAIKTNICDEFSSLESNVWEKYDQVIKKQEEELFALDTEIEKYLDKYKFDFDSIVPDGDKQRSSVAMLL